MPKPKWFGESIVMPVANPAAGSPALILPPAGTVWLLRSLTAVFVTSAAVANRQLYIAQRNGIADAGYLFSPALETASTTAQIEMHSVYTGLPLSTLSRRIFPLGQFYYVDNAVYLLLGADNLQAGDQFSAIYVNVFRMLEE